MDEVTFAVVYTSTVAAPRWGQTGHVSWLWNLVPRLCPGSWATMTYIYCP